MTASLNHSADGDVAAGERAALAARTGLPAARSEQWRAYRVLWSAGGVIPAGQLSPLYLPSHLFLQ